MMEVMKVERDYDEALLKKEKDRMTIARHQTGEFIST